MKKIFILGASALQVPAIKKAKEKGLYVYALDYDDHAVGIADADEFLCISTIDKEAVLEAAKKYNPDFIITSTSDMPVRTVAWVNEQLGKKSEISYEDAICATDKSAMRDRMKACGVPIPEYHVAASEEEFLNIAENMGERFVSKPADNAASRGVVLVHRGDDLKEIYSFTKQFSRSGKVLIEEFMEGPEVSVESFTVEGETHIITITDKLVTELPFFVETGHTEPSRLSEDKKKDIRETALKAIKAIGIVNGPTHTEIKVTPTGAKLVEIAARLGGDFITSRLVPLSTGVDLIECCINSTLGEEVRWQSTIDRGSAIRFLHAPDVDNIGDADSSNYVITNISGIAEAKQLPGVEEIAIYKNPGDKVTSLKSSGDRIGHVIASGSNADEASDIAEKATAKIQINMSPLK